MRFIVKAMLDIEAGNEAARTGKLGSTMAKILDEVKPEAAFFVAEDGRRTAMLIVDIADAAQIPAIAEPFFLAFNADVTFHAAMTLEDLQKAGPSIGAAVEKYG